LYTTTTTISLCLLSSNPPTPVQKSSFHIATMMAFQSLLREDDVYVFYSDSSEDGELSNDDYFSPFSNTWYGPDISEPKKKK